MSDHASSYHDERPRTTAVTDSDRVAALQVAVVALSELLRQQSAEMQGRWVNCLQQTRDMPENLPLSPAFDELLALVDHVQRDE
ncbi:hypothetical protein [Zymobacter sp. IVIA_5232.4 C2]|uniref:hypothetical protein n=1 Tax=Zymobacter sp. IVIA_5232.4 C2 TaxID=3394855 RepID=UPI0039C28581